MSRDRRRLAALPAARGMTWLTEALTLFGRQAPRLLLLGLLLQLLALLSQRGVLGVIFVLCVPALSAGMMQAMHAAGAGLRPSPATLFCAFRKSDRLLRLVSLGALMLGVGLLAVVFVLYGALSELDAAVLARLEQGEVEALLEAAPGLLERAVFALVVGLLVSGTLSYFAVPLIWFSNQPLGHAIRLGLAGMLRNWKPLLVLGLFLCVLAAPVVLLSSLMLGLSAVGEGANPVLTLVMMFVAVAYQVLLFAVQYVSFGDVFRLPAPREPQEDEGQLAA